MISSHSDTSREDKPTPARAEGAGREEKARRFATKSLGTGAPKRADLSLISYPKIIFPKL